MNHESCFLRYPWENSERLDFLYSYIYLKNLDLTSEQGFNKENPNFTGNLKNF